MLKVGRKRKRKERKTKNTQTQLPGFELALLDQLFNSFACLKLHHAAKKTKYKTRSISEYLICQEQSRDPPSEKETLLTRFQMKIKIRKK